MANTALRELYFAPEAVRGVVANTTTFKRLRFNSNAMKLTKASGENDEITGDYRPLDIEFDTRMTEGDITCNIYVDDATEELLEAALGGTAVSGVISDGSEDRSFTFIEVANDISTGKYKIYTGVQITGYSLSLVPSDQKPKTITYNTSGLDMEWTDTLPTGAVLSAASTAWPMKATGTPVSLNGTTYGCATQIDMAFSNNMTAAYYFGSETPTCSDNPYADRAEKSLTGTLTITELDNAQYLRYQNEEANALIYTLADCAGGAWVFDVKRFKYTDYPSNADGVGVVRPGLPFTAAVDSSSGVMITVATDLLYIQIYEDYGGLSCDVIEDLDHLLNTTLPNSLATI